MNSILNIDLITPNIYFNFLIILIVNLLSIIKYYLTMMLFFIFIMLNFVLEIIDLLLCSIFVKVSLLNFIVIINFYHCCFSYWPLFLGLLIVVMIVTAIFIIID